MSPAEAIEMLDRQIAEHGQPVTVAKRGGSSATVQGHVRAAKATDLVGPVQQSWRKVILSPTGLSSILPLVKGDTITIDGKVHQVDFPAAFRIGATLVRFEVMVAG